MSSWLFYLLRLSRRIWVRAGLISLLAVLAAALSPLVGPALPDRFTESITLDSTRRLLDILSTTMLTVTTFSLTVITAAHLTAAQAITPRVHRLLREDSRTQTVLATFMGAFVYAIVTIVLLNLRIHEKEDFGTVYVFTVLVLVLVTVAVLRWIQHLTTLGAMDETVSMVEAQARDAFDRERETPNLGGVPCAAGDDPPGDAKVLKADRFGFLQTVDLPALDRLAEARGGRVRLASVPGDWIDRGRPLAWITGGLAEAGDETLLDAFVIGETRTFSHDPHYGLIVLSEIASRALSPAVNDPRSAENVLLRMHRLLASVEPPSADRDPTYPWLEVPAQDPDLLFRLSIDPIARDGRAFVEVHLRIQKVLARLADHADPEIAAAARRASARALEYAEAGLTLSDDLMRIRAEAPV